VLEILLHDLFGQAMQAYKNARLRTLKDLDRAAIMLTEACQPLLDPALPDGKLRATAFAKIPRAALAQALEDIRAMVRPPDDVYYRELVGRYRSVRGFLPVLLSTSVLRRTETILNERWGGGGQVLHGEFFVAPFLPALVAGEALPSSGRFSGRPKILSYRKSMSGRRHTILGHRAALKNSTASASWARRAFTSAR
jgi:hypothetical protein